MSNGKNRKDRRKLHKTNKEKVAKGRRHKCNPPAKRTPSISSIKNTVSKFRSLKTRHRFMKSLPYLSLIHIRVAKTFFTKHHRKFI